MYYKRKIRSLITVLQISNPCSTYPPTPYLYFSIQDMKTGFPKITRLSLLLIITSLCIQLSAQTTITYPAVSMPEALKGTYWGRFDPKLMAEDVALLLQKATGETFRLQMNGSKSNTGISFYLDPGFSNDSQEAGKLETDGKTFLRFSAKYATGLSYALYSWLEEKNFHFSLPGEEWILIPKLKTIYNGKAETKIYAPAFRMRMMAASGGIYPIKGLDENKTMLADWNIWLQRNRMGCDYLGVDGHIGEYFNMVHKAEIEKDPAILAPVDGKRQYNQTGKLDPTYQPGVNLFTNWIVDEFEKRKKTDPDFLPFKKYPTVDAGDGLNYCHTPECEKAFPTVSDQMFSISNQAAKKIKKVDARAGVGTMAYTERADTPHLKIEPNVHVMVVPTAFQSASTAAELMQRWRKKHSNISQYDYLNIGVWAYDMPFYDMNRYHDYLQFLQKLKIDGLLYETSFSKFATGVQQYLILKFLADPYNNPEKILSEYCQLNFEQAAIPIEKLLKAWYFSPVHLQTNYDRPSFYPDELGNFVNWLDAAENTSGISEAVKKRIEELKGYTVYLCKYYELFAELSSQAAFAKDATLKTKKVEALLTYTWQLYPTRIFHNTQLNDMLIQWMAESERGKWQYQTQPHIANIQVNIPILIRNEFKAMYNKYGSQAQEEPAMDDARFDQLLPYAADSFRIKTMDEKAFGNFVYPLSFYCNKPGTLRIRFQTGSSQAKTDNEKFGIVGVESADYLFLDNRFIRKENSEGNISFQIPAKGHYKLYLGQYQATPASYVVYAKNQLFYFDKKSIMMNGLQVQEPFGSETYSNRYLGIVAPESGSLMFGDLYYSSNNTSKYYDAAGKLLSVVPGSQKGYYVADLKKGVVPGIIFYENQVYRWPPVLVNAVPYYFFLRFPMKN